MGDGKGRIIVGRGKVDTNVNRGGCIALGVEGEWFMR